MKILAISVSGIGNTILFTPVLRSLRKRFPGVRIDLLTWSRAMAVPVEGSGLVDQCLVMPPSLSGKLSLLWRLRRECYDSSVIAFPSNKMQFHVLSFLIGARKRFSHRYPGFHVRTLGFLETDTVCAVEGLHDVEQNMKLLPLFGIEPGGEERGLVFHLGENEKAFARQWREEHKVPGHSLIGVHPGAGGALADWQGSAKRWPLDRFVEVCAKLIEQQGGSVLVFGGSEERALKEQLITLVSKPGRIWSVDAGLKETAALISGCDLMISNDSGLMHVAVATGVPTLGIFGPTRASRTAPYGPANRYVQGTRDESELLGYPFRCTSSKIDRAMAQGAFEGVSADSVLAVAREMIQASQRRSGTAN